ncbi:MAG: hypothetical protein HQL37_12095 [Alphaproteobacteria bacterium]|nr:hypothetical protein [Alphaproteobacteria bacterium]
MKVEIDGYKIDFTDAIDAFVFDERDESKEHFHKAPMKAVDIIAEFEGAYVFVELKDYDEDTSHGSRYKADRGSFNWLKKSLKYKFRDTYLFRYAEDKLNKPIHYICLLTFDNALNSTMRKALAAELPVGIASKQWARTLAESCQVVNVEKWNRNFPKWPVSRAP